MDEQFGTHTVRMADFRLQGLIDSSTHQRSHDNGLKVRACCLQPRGAHLGSAPPARHLASDT